MRDRSKLSEGSGGQVSKRKAKRGYPLVLAGGFPCQDLSIAGRGAGLRGDRSGLWSEFRRAIAEIRPDWVVIENVGHTWRRWVPTVRTDLAALLYSSLPLRVRAADLGAPHERSRIFLVAHADCELLRELSRWWCGAGREVAQELGRTWNQEPGVPRMDDGISNRVDRNRAVGNAIVPQIAQIIAEGIKAVSA
jgi:DNA (cytosine-5)-methyltransferase 1